jgi:hypothetical protein
MTILEAFKIAEQEGSCYYRPINGDIVHGAVKMNNSVMYECDVNLDTIKEKYFEWSDHFVDGGYLYINIKDGRLGITYDK